MKDNNDQTNHYEGALLEAMDDKIHTILEILVPLAAQVNKMDMRLIRVESDVKIITSAVTEHGLQLIKHNKRITHLEKSI